MKFRQYEKYAIKTVKKDYTAVFFALGLASKVGQVCDLIKKQQCNACDNSESIKEILGDTLWYVTMLAQKTGSSLEEVAVENLEVLADLCEEEAGQSKVSND